MNRASCFRLYDIEHIVLSELKHGTCLNINLLRKSEVMKLKQIICWTVVQPVLSRELMHDGKGWEKCFARRLKGKND